MLDNLLAYVIAKKKGPPSEKESDEHYVVIIDPFTWGYEYKDWSRLSVVCIATWIHHVTGIDDALVAVFAMGTVRLP